MDCEEVRERLLDVLENAATPQEREAVQAHLAECEACRTELARLKRGMAGLTTYLSESGVKHPHETSDQVRRMLAAIEEGSRKASAVTWRRFVASAAAAAILVSCYFIYHDLRLLDKIRRSGESPVAVTPVELERYAPGMQVALTSSAGDRRQSVVQGYVRVGEIGGTAAPAPPRGDLILTSSPGVYVPVNNVFYDSEEADYWW